jgi:DNA recombination protein RmuC
MTELLPLVIALLVGVALGASVALIAIRSSRQPDTSLAAERAAVDALVRPVNETLARVASDLARSERDRASAYAELREQIRATALGSEALRSETGKLVSALRRSEVRGRWGEVQLRRLVESSGMLAHVDFDEQSTTRDDSGEALRPDLVVHLADARDIIIDAKVPLSSFIDAAQADDDATQQYYLNRHVVDVQSHIDRLAAKEYWQRYNSPEFVVLFLPAEAFLSHALDQRPDLLEYAFARNIVIATPTTLLALLRTVSYTWRQDEAVKNVREVQTLARDLHGRLATFGSHLAKIGSALDSAIGHYNSSVGSYESRVLVSARRLAHLGAVEIGEDADAGLPQPRLVRTSARSVTGDGALSQDPDPRFEVLTSDNNSPAINIEAS